MLYVYVLFMVHRSVHFLYTLWVTDVYRTSPPKAGALGLCLPRLVFSSALASSVYLLLRIKK